MNGFLKVGLSYTQDSFFPIGVEMSSMQTNYKYGGFIRFSASLFKLFFPAI